ncbi:MAG: glycosyltransferase family 1 protein [Mariprofundales bacterium]
MKIGVDARLLAGSTHLSGVSQYARHLLTAMIRKDDHRLVLFAGFDRRENRTVYSHLGLTLDDDRVQWSRLPSRLLELLWQAGLWPIEHVLGEMDLFFAPNFFPPHLDHTPQVCTIHDLSFVRSSSWFPPSVAKRRYRLMASTLERVDGVIAVSQFTANEIIDIWPEHAKKVRVIHEAPGSKFVAQSDRDIALLRSKLGLERPFLLYLGALELRKNIGRLLSGFALFRKKNPEVMMVLAGAKGFGYEHLSSAIEQARDEGWLHCLGFVEQEDLPPLYAASRGVCYLSLYEGFGLPPLEAVSCGAPVLVSDIPLFHEVLGESAWYANPKDCVDIAHGMQAMMDANGGAMGALPHDYSWQRAAEETTAFFQQVVA